MININTLSYKLSIPINNITALRITTNILNRIKISRFCSCHYFIHKLDMQHERHPLQHLKHITKYNTCKFQVQYIIHFVLLHSDSEINLAYKGFVNIYHSIPNTSKLKIQTNMPKCANSEKFNRKNESMTMETTTMTKISMLMNK